MTARKLSEAAYLTIKAAARRLISAAGGLEAAAGQTRVNKTVLGYFAQTSHDQHMPADIIADLEADIGDPIVTRELARLAGYALVPEDSVTDEQRLMDPALMAVKIARDLGKYAQSVEDMDKDGIREAHEVRRCLEQMKELHERVGRCCDGLYEHLMLIQAKAKV